MGKSQRTKGKAGELEACQKLRAYDIRADRNLTQTRDGGDDIDTSLGHVEVKRGNHVPLTLYKFLENNPAFAMVRRDRADWLVVMTFERFMEYLEK